MVRQYFGRVGTIDRGIVAVTSLWVDERCYWPVHIEPYSRGIAHVPARRGSASQG